MTAMSDTAGNLRTRRRSRRPRGNWRSPAGRERMLETAMRRFAEHGYHRTRVEDIADDLGVAKGSIFLHFKSKEGLFLEVYKRATTTLKRYLDAPRHVLDKGFFEVVRYWLEHTEKLTGEYAVPFRVAVLGDYAVDLGLQRAINRFHAEVDPAGMGDFIRYGRERGELRADIEPTLLASTINWMVERFQDALLSEELDPGLFHHDGSNRKRIDQFIRLLRDAVGRR